MPHSFAGRYPNSMTERVDECRQRAQHCERAGSLAVTLEARLMYADLAEQWRKLAEQIEWFERRSGIEGSGDVTD
jgi:hypothetical protein